MIEAVRGLTSALVDTVSALTLACQDYSKTCLEGTREMLELHDVDLKQTRFYQEVFAEGLTEGEARGATKLLRKSNNQEVNSK